MPQEASRLLQDGLLEHIWTQHGPKLAQVGPMLAPSWLQLGSSWAHVEPRSGSSATPEPTLALPNPIKEATPHPPGLGSRIWSLGSAFWTSQTPNLDPKTAPHGSKKIVSRLPIHSPGPVDGRSIFIYIIQEARACLGSYNFVEDENEP